MIVEAKAAAAGADGRAAASAELEHHVKSRIGVTCAVVVVAPGEVERSLGKAKRVVDLRPKD